MEEAENTVKHSILQGSAARGGQPSLLRRGETRRQRHGQGAPGRIYARRPCRRPFCWTAGRIRSTPGRPPPGPRSTPARIWSTDLYVFTRFFAHDVQKHRFLQCPSRGAACFCEAESVADPRWGNKKLRVFYVFCFRSCCSRGVNIAQHRPK